MKRFFLFVFVFIYMPVVAAQALTRSSPVGYETVEEAFTALEADPEAAMTEYEGWTIFNQKNEGVYTIWSFTPEDHATHPTVIRRDIVKRGDEVLIEMNALCHSSKFDCDQLIEEFKKINQRIRDNLANESQ
jgi:hypothetical protein